MMESTKKTVLTSIQGFAVRDRSRRLVGTGVVLLLLLATAILVLATTQQSVLPPLWNRNNKNKAVLSSSSSTTKKNVSHPSSLGTTNDDEEQAAPMRGRGNTHLQQHFGNTLPLMKPALVEVAVLVLCHAVGLPLFAKLSSVTAGRFRWMAAMIGRPAAARRFGSLAPRLSRGAAAASRGSRRGWKVLLAVYSKTSASKLLTRGKKLAKVLLTFDELQQGSTSTDDDEEKQPERVVLDRTKTEDDLSSVSKGRFYK